MAKKKKAGRPTGSKNNVESKLKGEVKELKEEVEYLSEQKTVREHENINPHISWVGFGCFALFLVMGVFTVVLWSEFATYIVNHDPNVWGVLGFVFRLFYSITAIVIPLTIYIES